MTADWTHEFRESLAEIASSVRAYIEWQEDTGATGIPRGSTKSSVSTTAPTSMPSLHATSPSRSSGQPAESKRDAQVPVVGASGQDDVQLARSDRRIPEFQVAEPTRGESSGAKRLQNDIDLPTRIERLPIVAASARSCVKCGLSATRTHAVFSRGNPAARICFVGEAPGAEEDEQGIPFVGRAGQLLDKMIGAMGLDPERDVYVCNIIKCRPPDNRRPSPEEIETCIPYLHEQLDLIRPKVIVALGNTAAGSILGTKLGISKLRGAWKLYRNGTLIMPTYHPSYLLRPSAQQLEAKKQVWEDLQAVMKELKLPPPNRGGGASTSA